MLWYVKCSCIPRPEPHRKEDLRPKLKPEPGLEMSLQPLWKISPTRFCRSTGTVEGEGEWKLSESWLKKGCHSSVHTYITCLPPVLDLKEALGYRAHPFSDSRALLLLGKQKQTSVNAVTPPACGQTCCSLASHTSIPLAPALLHLYRIKK